MHPEPDAVEGLWTFFNVAIPSLLNNVLEICLGDQGKTWHQLLAKT